MISIIVLFLAINLFFGLVGFAFRLSWKVFRLVLGLLMGIGTYVLVFVFAVPLLMVVPMVLLVFGILRGLFRIIF